MKLIHWIKKIFFSLAFLKYQITGFHHLLFLHIFMSESGLEVEDRLAGKMTRLCLSGRADPSVFAPQQQTEWQRYLRQSLEVVAKVMELLPTHAFSTLVTHHLEGNEEPNYFPAYSTSSKAFLLTSIIKCIYFKQ